MFSSRISIVLLLGVIGLLLAWLGNPIFIPDSYEQAIVAECWRDGTSMRIDCDSIFPWFRPPLPSILITLGLHWIDSITMLLILCWIATVATCGIVFHRIQTDFGTTECGSRVGLIVLTTLSGAGLIQELGLLADSKIIALPFIFGASGLLLSTRISRWKSFGIGILLGLSFLTRFENLLLITSGIGMVFIFSKQRWKNSLLYFAGCGPFVIAWMWILQRESNRWTLSPRYWEQWIVLLMDELPLRWVQELYGMGIWNPPLRSLALLSTIDSQSNGLLQSFSILEWLAWLNIHVVSLFHPIVVTVIVLNTFLWRHNKRLRKWMLILIWVSLPSLAVTILPQGREEVFPVAYVLPLWCAVWIWIGLSTSLIIVRVERMWQKTILVLGLLGLTQLPTSIDRPPNLEFSPAAMTVQHWFQTYTPKNSIVLSSFESAPIVWLAKRQWQEWPSPWEANHRIPTVQQQAPLYGLVWVFDHHAWYSLAFEERYYEPEAYIYTTESSFLIFDLSE